MREATKDRIAETLKDIREDEAIQDYEKLKQIDLKKVTNETRIGNKFVDFFTFRERLETISKRGMSFFDFVEDTDYHKRPYIKRMIDYQGADENKYVALYRVFKLHCGSIGLFKPVTAMEMYARFRPQSVLDFTMGWGGRLVGACALDVPRYTGIDMNRALKRPYEQMVQMLKRRLGTHTQIRLLFKDALKVDYSKLDYDCVLTSPPYYAVEVYSGMDADAVADMTEEEWNEEFYKPLFEQTYRHMRRGGHYILNIPVQIYKDVCLPLFGRANHKIPLKKKAHPKNGVTEKDYTENLYVWVK